MFTDDVLKEEVVLKSSLLLDFLHDFTKQTFISRPIELQKNDQVTSCCVVQWRTTEKFILQNNTTIKKYQSKDVKKKKSGE